MDTAGNTAHGAAPADGAAIDSAPDQSLDSFDRAILAVIQSAFPLEKRPYEIIGESIGLTENECFERVRSLRRRGLIRRIGANFQSSRLGFKSTLCAAKVPPKSLEAFAEAVNAEPGVTHNYLRDHSYNVWFTCIGPSWESVCATVAAITRKTGVPVINLPAKRMYKIKVDFDMNRDGALLPDKGAGHA